MRECDYYCGGLCGADAAVSYRMAADAVDTLEARLANEPMSDEARLKYEALLKEKRQILSAWERLLPNMAVEGAISSVTVVKCSLEGGRGECSGRPD